jgi:dephospho-CoA kinase
MHGQNSQQQGSRFVIGITGRIGAGKTSVGTYVKERYGFYYIRYSQVLSDWLAKNPDSKAHLQAVGWEVMAGGMQAELNNRLIARIPTQRDCAVDGLRHPLDHESLSKAFSPNLYLLYVESRQETRWQRLKQKDEKRFPTLDDFRQADLHPVEQQIDSLREKAFVILNNDASLEQLYSTVDSVLSKIREGG